MKTKIVILIMTFLLNCLVYSQNVVYIKAQDYEGYIFPKATSILGFPPAANRYTIDNKDIEKAEGIIQNNIRNIYKQLFYKKCSNRKARKTFRRYIRQYVGYIMDNNHIIVDIHFTKKGVVEDKKFKEDVICIWDGGTCTWSVKVDLTNQTLNELSMNGVA